MAPPPPAPIAASAAAPPPAWRADPRLPWVVLALSLLLTLVATLAGLREAQQRRRARFEAAAQAVVDRLEVRLQGHVALLQGVAGLFSGSDDVTREEFRAYLEQLQVAQRFPGVQGVGYSPRVRPGEEVAVVARALAEGLQGFRLWPEPGPGDAGRPRFTILFLEPLDARNRAALGYDMSTEPVRAAAMARARDTGQPALSGKVELKQEIGPQKQPGFLLYLPLYERGRGPRLAQEQRARLEGYVYAPFRAGDFFGHLQADLGPSPVGFEVYDGPRADPATLLYASHPGAPREPGYAYASTLSSAGRTWTLVFHARPGFATLAERAVRPSLGVLGVLVSFALFALTRAQARERARTDALHESEERFRALALHSSSLLWRADGSGAHFDAPGWLALTGQGETQMHRGNWLEVVHPEDRERVAGAWARALERAQPLELEFRLCGTAKECRWVLNRGVPLLHPDGRVREWVGTLTDVSERRMREQEALQRAEFEQQLIGIVSHDLRTPLSAIAMSASTLQAAGNLDERQRRALARIQSSTGRANRMIEALLDFTRARLGSGIPVHPRPADLHDVARHAVEEAQAAHPGRRVELGCEGELHGEWDPERLEQLLGNLLGNALRYGDPQAPVQVRCEPEEGEAGGVRLRVHNAGEPIPAGQLPSLFEPFRQGANGSSAKGGLGLGLFIVSEIVRAHGGRVEVASSAEAGTTFTVHLPRSSAAGV